MCSQEYSYPIYIMPFASNIDMVLNPIQIWKYGHSVISEYVIFNSHFILGCVDFSP